MQIPDVNTQNYAFRRLQSVVKRLDTQPSKPSNQNPFKDLNVVGQRIRKR